MEITAKLLKTNKHGNKYIILVNFKCSLKFVHTKEYPKKLHHTTQNITQSYIHTKTSTFQLNDSQDRRCEKHIQ